MAWKSFNLLMDKPRVLVLDARPPSLFAAAHIRGSVCVSLRGSTLVAVAGPGPPTWSSNCWWDRHVLLVTRPSSRKRKAGEDHPSSHEVFSFLQEEGLVRSLQILETEQVEDDAFTSFAKSYPFLITRSTKAREIERYPSEIVPGFLFLGDLTHATSQSCLENLQISDVLTIHTELLKLPKSYMHIFFELEDAPCADIAQYFEPMYEFVERARSAQKRVLIHCGAGVSRSPTLCAAYLMRTRHWGVEDTLRFLKEQRSKVDPNLGFLSALHEYSRLLGSSGLDLRSEPVVISNNSMHWHLDVMKLGDLIGCLRLNHGSTSFGRDKDCDVILDHASISREHALVTKGENGELQIVDNQSTHGTFINGKAITKRSSVVLKNQDILQFGASSRRYVICSKPSCCA